MASRVNPIRPMQVIGRELRFFLILLGFALASSAIGAADKHSITCNLGSSNQEAQAKSFAQWNSTDWLVEQMPGGQVRFEKEKLVIEDKAGCTVWLKVPLKAPLKIQFKAKLLSNGGPLDRVSDLNCFWMASDPAVDGGSVLAPSKKRTGAFKEYDSLKCYYVGMGGNTNSSTRFRRYEGNGDRPLLPEHDLKGPQVLLEANKEYLIEIKSSLEGIRYSRDGLVIFDWKDPRPLTGGHFGFRTVWSHIEIRDFRVSY